MQFFFPVRGFDLPLMKLQDAVDAAFRRLLRLVPVLDGVLLEGVEVSTTARDVAHQLGRPPRGFIVVKRSVPITVYATDSSLPDLNLTLTANGTDVVSLWVF